MNATKAQASVPDIDPQEALITDLRVAVEEMEHEPATIRDFMRGLLTMAIDRLPLPYHRGVPALKPLARDMGLPFFRSAQPVGKRHLALLEIWGPRFPKRHAPSTGHKPRTRLPGIDGEGTDVPTQALVAAMKADAAKMGPTDRRTLLNHMIHVAETTRTLPQWRGEVNMKVVRLDAKLNRSHVSGATAAIELKEKWAGFFHLSKEKSITTQGKVRSSSTGLEEIKSYLAYLRTCENPLQYRAPTGAESPSFAAAADWAGISVRSFNRGEAGDLLRADAEERGLREVWPGPSRAIEEAKQARREELIVFVKECAEAGIPLVAKKEHRRSIDHEDLITRAGKPGFSLDGDQKFLKMVKETGVAIVPWTPPSFDDIDYNHVIDAAPVARSAHIKDVNSRASTKSRTKSAIEDFRDFVGAKSGLPAGHNRVVHGDFQPTPAEFEKLLAEMKASGACGKTPSTFLTAIRWVRTWIIEQRSDDGLGNDFSTAIRVAASRSPRLLIDIAKEAGVTKGCLTQWISGVSVPAGENVARMPALAVALGLNEDRLSRLLESVGPTGQDPKRKLPKRMKAHAPDTWRTMTHDEFEEFKEYVDSWLLHRSTMSGAVSRAAARKRVAEDVRQRELGHELVGVGTRLQSELTELIEHMTKEFGTTLHRRPGMSWEAKTTAVKNTGRLVDFAKWQTQPLSEGGLGRDPEHLTLADLLHPALVFSYIDYKARVHEDVTWNHAKRGKLFTSTESDFLVLAATLTARDYGWVTQQPDLARRIQPDARMLPTFAHIDGLGRAIDDDEEQDAPKDGGLPIIPASLRSLTDSEFVAKARDAELRYRQAGADLDNLVEGARDPMEPIQPIIDHPEPLLVLLTHLYSATEREPSRARDELQFHLHRRDALINRLFALTALRSTNVRELRFDGPTPNLVWDKFKKQWLLQIHWRNFKNFRSAPLFGRKRHREWYRKYLPNENGLSEMIDQYVKDSRPWFLNRLAKGKAVPDHLFFTKTGNELNPQQMWTVVFNHTGQHVAHNRYKGTGVPGCQPFGPHSYRDIRATDILLHPCETDAYLEAANALQTSPAMIVSHYGRVRSEVRNAVSDKRFMEVAKIAASAARLAA